MIFYSISYNGTCVRDSRIDKGFLKSFCRHALIERKIHYNKGKKKLRTKKKNYKKKFKISGQLNDLFLNLAVTKGGSE